jgi:hypothetical protein
MRPGNQALPQIQHGAIAVKIFFQPEARNIFGNFAPETAPALDSKPNPDPLA